MKRLEELKNQLQEMIVEISAIESQIERDDLTQLLRRQAFFEKLNDLKSTADRDGLKLGILVTDIDHFKKINDTHGHLVGDKVLKKVADVCRQFESDRVLMGRFGGEEFVVGIAGTVTEINQLAEKLRQSISEFSVPIHCTVSIGVAFWGSQPNHASEAIDTALEHADRALYQAKEGGRNRVVTALQAA